MTPALTISLASVSDRDDLVAEVWCGKVLLAEARVETGVGMVHLYPSAVGAWDVPIDELITTFATARDRLRDRWRGLPPAAS